MAVYYVEGGNCLFGECEIQGSKNAVLPLMAAALLNEGYTVLHNCPDIKDVHYMSDILCDLGCKIWHDKNLLIIDATEISPGAIGGESVSNVRASILIAGAMLSRVGHVMIGLPGGCRIGERPTDFHFDAFEKMGVSIIHYEDGVECECDRMKGCEINLPFPSVGATENIILAATGAEGITIINGAAREPEIADLCLLLQQFGILVEGAGTSRITIKGSKGLTGGDVAHSVICDRIVAGTYAYAAAAAKGCITCKINNLPMMESILNPLSLLGCKIEYGNDYFKVTCHEMHNGLGSIVTAPYPGFPTDMQSQLMSVLVTVPGKSVIEENIFEKRYHIAGELAKMGACIHIKNDIAVIEGVDCLHGENVRVCDLRGGAALIIAGLCAKGATVVDDAFGYIDRGYENIVGDFTRLGGCIQYE